MATTGYRLTDGRYFIITTEGGEVVAIRQVLFGCGIYPAPVKPVAGEKWPEVLALTGIRGLLLRLPKIHKNPAKE